MSAEAILDQVHRTVSPAMGEIALALAARRGVSRRAVAAWRERLKRADEMLEKLS